ncbi:UDP-N-acetylglucosamine 2-epimerase (non-hydrolyzing) [Rhodoferax koreense]|uniref:UDP-N-acetylglucosamine 2-epimerase (non-hydrolyzing) n=1 Tax=Rhodoferax koreensis TaxID=1842727 RepID=A0A1P8JTY2_9BURK|nr:UDP-N-acetylglucosamine 2-epimerase (non-hydrolyzing) [Rhodoferax koreense]APW37185.1 UDP-N-acetylglucosamine 2-epimerase (non-hydrolyzing) [Rhodoferax koreense]
MTTSFTAAPDTASRNPILISVGTRPEIIKMAPVYAELRRRGMPVAWVHTGQHREMAESLYSFFDIAPEHEVMLERRNGSLAHLNALLLEGLSDVFEKVRPSAVLVHGDTTSTLGSAQAAFYLDIPIGHVEAGLRTFNAREPFPEEKNRELTARLARWHFAPTPGAAANLNGEGLAAGGVHMVGNTAVDAALAGTSRLAELLGSGRLALPGPLQRLQPHLARCRLITVTAHRRENWGPGIRNIARAVARLLAAHDDLAVVWPVHGNPAVSDVVHAELGALADRLEGRLCLCPPLDYPALLWCLQHSLLALTDSGGIQEEGAALSCPVLVLRSTTERPELIEAGAGLIVGTDADHVLATVTQLLKGGAELKRMRRAVNPFGDGHTARRIADVLAREIEA